LYAGLVGWLTLNESIGWHHAVGAAMILPGIYLASQAPSVAVVKNEN
jgi:drug/metabolite transporter (DMT)-like permease